MSRGLLGDLGRVQRRFREVFSGIQEVPEDVQEDTGMSSGGSIGIQSNIALNMNHSIRFPDTKTRYQDF